MANYTSTINCSADTYLYYNAINSNFGNSSALRVGFAYGYKTYSVLGFDLSSIPQDKIITSIDMYFRINGFTTMYPGSDGSEFSTSLLFPVKARRLYNNQFAEIESSMTYQTIYNNDTSENITRYNSGAMDSSVNISASAGGYTSVNIRDITRSEDNKLLVGMRVDETYIPSSIKVQTCYAGISSREGSYSPYLVVYYTDPTPSAPTNLAPNNTIRNKQGGILLAWQSESPQKSYTVQCSTNNFASSTTYTGTNISTSSYTIPANIFTDGTVVKWRVRITDNTNTISNYSEIASFTIGATTPSVTEIISPSDTTVNSNDDIYFRWRFVDAYGYTQARYDLQYRKGTEAEVTVSNITSSQLYILPKNTIGGGTYSWRIRCYNAFNEVSTYSNWASFYSIGAPQTPIITSITNNMKPTINWIATEQDLFIIKIYKNETLVYNTEEQPSGTDNTYTITEFLDDGSYKATLQISNIYGFWSTEVSYNFTVSTTKPIKPSIYGNATSDFTTTLFIETSTNVNIIYRKGIKDTEFKQIASINNNNYLDYSAPYGTNLYFVRSVNGSGFNDSEIISTDLIFNGIILSDYNNYSNYINLWTTLNADKRKTVSVNKNQFIVHCNGRVFPIVQSTEFKDHTESHEYSIKPEEYDKVYNILNSSTLLYRNNKGFAYPVQIGLYNLNENELDRYVVSFTLNRLED